MDSGIRGGGVRLEGEGKIGEDEREVQEMGIGDGMEDAGIYGEREAGVGKIEAEGGKKGVELLREIKRKEGNSMGEEMFGRDRGQRKEGEWIIEMGKGGEKNV